MARPESPRRPLPDVGAADPERLKRAISRRFAVRLHVALILGGCVLVALAVSKMLLMSGVDSMLLRYPLALCAGYGAFLVGVRLWLHFAGFDGDASAEARGGGRVRGGSALDGLDLPVGGGSGGGSGSSSGGGSVFRGGGGGFGGGGASSSFGEGSLSGGSMGGPGSSAFGFVSGDAAGSAGDGAGSVAPSGGSSSGGFSLKGLFGGGRGGGSGGGGGGGDLGDGIWVLVALVALAAAMFGAFAWLIYAAPTILADAAFSALLSAGLARKTHAMTSGSWVGSVIGHTWLAFAVVLALTLTFGWLAHKHNPDARTMAEVIRRL
jgi:hypothetical protein